MKFHTRKWVKPIDKIVMVTLDENGNPKAHKKIKVEYVKDRLKR